MSEMFAHISIHFTPSVCGCMRSRETECLCMHENASGHFVCVFAQSETRGGECRSPLRSSAALRGIASLIAVEKPHQCQAALIYVPEPLHLQLLSIRLYNIPPIVQLAALSALPRPVSKDLPHTQSQLGSGEKRREGV